LVGGAPTPLAKEAPADISTESAPTILAQSLSLLHLDSAPSPGAQHPRRGAASFNG